MQPAWLLWLTVLVCGGLMVLGCQQPEAQPLEVAGPQMSSAELEALRAAPLRLLLVGDAAWGEEIQIQFQARGETQLEITAIDSNSWYQASPTEIARHDMVICPPDRIAELAVGGHLMRLTPSQLEKWNHLDWLPLDRRMARLDQEVFGISLGGPLWSVIYHPESIRTDGDQTEIPTTWTEWQAAIQRDRQRGLERQWLEPLGGLGAAYSLLLRAASMAKGPAQTDVFLARIDGQPRLTSPPFIRGLEELKATYDEDLSFLRDLTVEAAIERVRSGQSKAALVPLPRQDDVNAGPAPFLPAPPLGSNRFYNYFDQAWSMRSGGEPLSTQLVGVDGRVVAILRKTRKSEAALRLIELLVAAPTAESFAAYQTWVQPFRRQHLSNLPLWAGRQYSAESMEAIQQLIAVTGDEVKGGAAILPPLPGNQARLAALNAAVWRVLDGHQEPADALQECQREWLEIAVSQGLEIQQTILNKNR